MSLLYVNPGYAEFFGTAFAGLTTHLETHSGDTTVSPNHGFSITNKFTNNTIVKIQPAFTKNGNYCTFYVHCNVYLGSSSTYSIGCSFPIQSTASTSRNFGFVITESAAKLALMSDYFAEGSTRSSISGYTGLLRNQVNRINLTITFDGHSQTPTILSVNDKTCQISENFIPTDNSILFGFLNSGGSANATYISDLIISDEEIPEDAQVAILPAGNIETNMESVEGGLYTPKSGDPTWLMTPNITPLLESHLSSSKVYGLAVGANPCQTTGTTTFTTLSKSDGTVTEHGTVTVTSADSGFSSGWLTDNTTLGDLANMQLGLKSSE